MLSPISFGDAISIEQLTNAYAKIDVASASEPRLHCRLAIPDVWRKITGLPEVTESRGGLSTLAVFVGPKRTFAQVLGAVFRYEVSLLDWL